MSNVACHMSPGKHHFQGIHKTENEVCPNCKATHSCKQRTRRLTKPVTAPCQKCPRCLMANGSSGIVPFFPLPYVCRHWLSAESPTLDNLHQPNCFHRHTCMQPLLKDQSINRPTSQIEITSTNPFIEMKVLTGAAAQRLNIDTTHKDELPMASRSNFLEDRVAIPDIIFSFNGVPIAKVVQPPWKVEDDQEILSNTKDDLDTCGWYYGNLTWQEAATLLTNSRKGTFLIRNSSTVKCPFALSVQTSQGPTSIRIEYERGLFWLNCAEKGMTPQFKNVMKLVSYYQDINIRKTEREKMAADIPETNGNNNIWLDHKGQVFSPISISKPLLKNPSSLKHLCRLSINSKVNAQFLENELPTSLILYLSKYPYLL